METLSRGHSDTPIIHPKCQVSVLCCCGSSNNVTDPSHSSNYWDICALRPLLAIDPIAVSQIQPRVGLRMRYNVRNDELIKRFSPLEVSSRQPEVDQMIRVMGYPNFDNLRIYWRRIESLNLNGMISVDVYCEEGMSGAPVVDREGKVIGIFTSSTLQTSYVEPAAHFVSLLANRSTLSLVAN